MNRTNPQCLPRRSNVRPGIRRILGLWLRDFKCVKEREKDTTGSYEVVHSDVDPSNQIFLRDILPVEKVVEIDRRRPGQVKIPYAARRRLGFLATGNREIVSCPVGILEEAFGAYNSLCRKSSIRLNMTSRTVLTPWMGEYPG